jgi:nitroimidazol reductase NimA-like FMN-containing flavoprotein (pyridoxamine 5'-phosphate oxidase superfamily)
MRRTDRELRDPAELRAVLDRADACHLALADQDTPYLVTLNFGIRKGERLALYFHCANEGRKIDVLRRNNRACFGVDVDREFFQADTGTSCGCSMRYRSVVGSGRVAFVTDPVEKLEGLTAILDHFTPGVAPRFTDEMVGRTTVLRLDVEEISGKRRA